MGFLFSHRLSFQIDSVSIVDQPIQDGIGNDFMPVVGCRIGEKKVKLDL